MGIKSFFKGLLYKLTKKILFNYELEELKMLQNSIKHCGENASIHNHCVILGAENISLGNNVVINSFVHIWGQGGITIGDDCLIASHSTITSLTHNTQSQKFNEENIAKPVKIGNNVWIGSHSIILPGVTIGNNVIIGAGSLVNTDLPDNAVYVGIPAKKLKNLDQFTGNNIQ